VRAAGLPDCGPGAPAGGSGGGGARGRARVPSPRHDAGGRAAAAQPRGGRVAAAGGPATAGSLPRAAGAQGPLPGAAAAATAGTAVGRGDPGWEGLARGPRAADAAVRLAEERARLAVLRGQLEAALARLDADRIAFERRKARRGPALCASPGLLATGLST